MKYIGIFGMSGDPPHCSHKVIINACLQQKLVDEVWVLPAFDHIQKKNVASFEQRIKMCKLMFEHWPAHIKVKDFEKWNKNGSTFNMIGILKEMFRGYTFCVIIGKDCADEIQTWYKYRELVSKVPFIVFNRGDYTSLAPQNWYLMEPHQFIQIDGCDFSSTFIRKLLKYSSYKIATAFTNKKVMKYIVKEKIYRN